MGDYGLYRNSILEQNYDVPRETVEVKLNKFLDHSYEFVRYGEADQAAHFDKLRKDRERLLSHFEINGWAPPPTDIDKEFLKHVKKFRATLDCYEQLVDEPIFSKGELYYRCLRDGPAFTEFIKKSRQQTLQALVSETEIDLDEMYVHEGYKGYDSILHEKFLIHWDDREDIDDVKYAFIPTRDDWDEEEIATKVSKLFDRCEITSDDFAEDFDMLRGMKNSMMHDPFTKKSKLMREFWSDDIDLSSPYYAKRTVVLVPGSSTRDTGVGDASTVLKVKIINELARKVHEKCLFSANAPSHIVQSRLKRVLKRNCFIHLDFKKYGLCIPRRITNIVIRELCKRAGIDCSNLIIDDFHLEIDGDVYKTSRGTCLGWFDAVNQLAISAILSSINEEYDLEFDHIGFNDDYEISFWSKGEAKLRMEALRNIILYELNIFDIALSVSKTYGSFGSIFLEKYVNFEDRYGLKMGKTQLCLSGYATSLVTTYKWRAKTSFAEAYMYVKLQYARDRCIDTLEPEFDHDEIYMPLFSGGWYLTPPEEMDDAIRQSDNTHLILGYFLSQWKFPKSTTKPERATTGEKLFHKINDKCGNSYRPELARVILGEAPEIEDINFEADMALVQVEYLCEASTNPDSRWSQRFIRYATERFSGKQPPPPSDDGSSRATLSS